MHPVQIYDVVWQDEQFILQGLHSEFELRNYAC